MKERWINSPAEVAEIEIKEVFLQKIRLTLNVFAKLFLSLQRGGKTVADMT